jgi:hypothetical protein
MGGVPEGITPDTASTSSKRSTLSRSTECLRLYFTSHLLNGITQATDSLAVCRWYCVSLHRHLQQCQHQQQTKYVEQKHGMSAIVFHITPPEQKKPGYSEPDICCRGFTSFRLLSSIANCCVR